MAEDKSNNTTTDELGEETDEETEEESGEDFQTLFEASQREGKRIQKDSKITGTIVSIGEEWAFVDVGAKSEGTIAREELLDDERRLQFAVGDKLTAYVVSTRDGEIRLSMKMTAAASVEAFRDAYRSGVPVEGLVTGQRKGGYTVKVFGKEAFCPYSQIDLHSGGSPESYLNNRFPFRITEYSDRGRNVVLSRKELLEEERLKQVAQLKQTLQPGDVVQGTVCNLTNFGAFVDIGGIEGLVPMSELAWHRVGDPADVLERGQAVTVKVLNLDWDRDRISLSLKQMLDNPWDAALERYPEDKVATGTVTKLMNYGAFVELEPGVEGLIHISNFGTGQRINHPREVLDEGQTVQVKILSVDQEARRIGLELKSQAADAEQPEGTPPKQGDVVSGTVEAVKDYGVFVRLPSGISGLLHVSEIPEGRRGDLRKRFPTGATIEVEVLDIDEKSDKVSLSLRSLGDKTEKAQFKDYEAGKAGGAGSFGTLGELLKDKLKKE